MIKGKEKPKAWTYGGRHRKRVIFVEDTEFRQEKDPHVFSDSSKSLSLNNSSQNVSSFQSDYAPPSNNTRSRTKLRNGDSSDEGPAFGTRTRTKQGLWDSLDTSNKSSDSQAFGVTINSASFERPTRGLEIERHKVKKGQKSSKNVDKPKQSKLKFSAKDKCQEESYPSMHFSDFDNYSLLVVTSDGSLNKPVLPPKIITPRGTKTSTPQVSGRPRPSTVEEKVGMEDIDPLQLSIVDFTEDEDVFAVNAGVSEKCLKSIKTLEANEAISLDDSQKVLARTDPFEPLCSSIKRVVPNCSTPANCIYKTSCSIDPSVPHYGMESGSRSLQLPGESNDCFMCELTSQLGADTHDESLYNKDDKDIHAVQDNMLKLTDGNDGTKMGSLSSSVSLLDTYPENCCLVPFGQTIINDTKDDPVLTTAQDLNKEPSTEKVLVKKTSIEKVLDKKASKKTSTEKVLDKESTSEQANNKTHEKNSFENSTILYDVSCTCLSINQSANLLNNLSAVHIDEVKSLSNGALVCEVHFSGNNPVECVKTTDRGPLNIVHDKRFTSSSAIYTSPNQYNSRLTPSSSQSTNRCSSFLEYMTPRKGRYQLSSREKLLTLCGQKDSLTFYQCLPTDKLTKCRKIGEGVYGEVFKTETEDHKNVALKIIPIEGQLMVNNEVQKTFDEILPEILISLELSQLQSDQFNKTENFVPVRNVSLVKGTYPDELLNEWDIFHQANLSENDRPDLYLPSQLFIIFEFDECGKDLDSFELKSAEEATSILCQTAAALAVAEKALQFEHRDLHLGNVLVNRTTKRKILFTLGGQQYYMPTYGVYVNIIDFTLARLTKDGCEVFCDVSNDESLFQGKGDYQFEIYRMMRSHNKNVWKTFSPYTNVLWIHFLARQLLGDQSLPTLGRTQKKKFSSVVNKILEYNSAEDLVNVCSFFNSFIRPSK